MQIQQRDKN